MRDIMKNCENISIDKVGFSVRTVSCLRRAKLLTLGDVANKTEKELQKVRNLGKRCIGEIIMKLEDYGLELKEEIDKDALYEEYCQMEENRCMEEEFDASEGRNIAFQVVMRDSHGSIETDHWGVVTNAGTFYEDGYPIEGGMYDCEIFGGYGVNVPFQKTETKKPEQIVGQMGVMALALPVCDPYCPKELDANTWVHLTAIPVLPTCCREMDSDGKWTSYEAKVWNELAELNFAIPKLLAKKPKRKAELQAKLQEAVNAVYAMYDQSSVPEDKLAVQLFLRHAMLPVAIEEDYDTMLSRIKTIKDMAEMMKTVNDAEDQILWVRHLCCICNIVGYDSDEVEGYLSWAESLLDEMDAWAYEGDL